MEVDWITAEFCKAKGLEPSFVKWTVELHRRYAYVETKVASGPGDVFTPATHMKLAMLVLDEAINMIFAKENYWVWSHTDIDADLDYMVRFAHNKEIDRLFLMYKSLEAMLLNPEHSKELVSQPDIIIPFKDGHSRLEELSAPSKTENEGKVTP